MSARLEAIRDALSRLGQVKLAAILEREAAARSALGGASAEGTPADKLTAIVARIGEAEEAKERAGVGLVEVDSGLRAVKGGLETMGVSGPEADEAISRALGLKVQAEMVLVDPDSRRVVIGQDTGVRVSERTVKLLVVMGGEGPRSTKELADDKRLFKRRPANLALGRDIHAANSELGPVLGAAVIEKAKKGVYVRSPGVGVLGEGAVAVAAVGEGKPEEAGKPAAEVFKIGEAAAEAGLSKLQVRNLAQGLIEAKKLEEGVHYVTRRDGKKEYTDYLQAGVDVLAGIKGAFRKLKKIPVSSVVEWMDKGKEREAGEGRFYGAAVARETGLGTAVLNRLAAMGYVETGQTEKGGVTYFMQKRPARAVELAGYIAKHGVKRVDDSLIVRVLGKPGSVEVVPPSFDVTGFNEQHAHVLNTMLQKALPRLRGASQMRLLEEGEVDGLIERTRGLWDDLVKGRVRAAEAEGVQQQVAVLVTKLVDDPGSLVGIEEAVPEEVKPDLFRLMKVIGQLKEAKAGKALAVLTGAFVHPGISVTVEHDGRIIGVER